MIAIVFAVNWTIKSSASPSNSEGLREQKRSKRAKIPGFQDMQSTRRYRLQRIDRFGRTRIDRSASVKRESRLSWNIWDLYFLHFNISRPAKNQSPSRLHAEDPPSRALQQATSKQASKQASILVCLSPERLQPFDEHSIYLVERIRLEQVLQAQLCDVITARVVSPENSRSGEENAGTPAACLFPCSFRQAGPTAPAFSMASRRVLAHHCGIAAEETDEAERREGRLLRTFRSLRSRRGANATSAGKAEIQACCRNVRSFVLAASVSASYA